MQPFVVDGQQDEYDVLVFSFEEGHRFHVVFVKGLSLEKHVLHLVSEYHKLACHLKIVL